MPGKLPFIQFFVDDHLSDERLSVCSLAAQGLWTRLLCLMHKCDRRGYLQQANGQPYSQAQLARMTGSAPEEVAHLMRELIDSGVPSATEHGILYSRRMVRDEHLRQVRSEAGQKGGKRTGRLLKQNVKQKSSKRSSKSQANSGSGSGDGSGEGMDSIPRQEVGEGGARGEGADAKATPKPRPRDLLFDAVAEVTATDPKASGWHIAKVCKALRSAEPPYTPEEVRLWAERLRESWPDFQGYPSLTMLEKNIGRVRAKPPPPPKENHNGTKQPRANPNPYRFHEGSDPHP